MPSAAVSVKKYDISGMLVDLEKEGIDPDIMSADYGSNTNEQGELEVDE